MCRLKVFISLFRICFFQMTCALSLYCSIIQAVDWPRAFLKTIGQIMAHSASSNFRVCIRINFWKCPLLYFFSSEAVESSQTQLCLLHFFLLLHCTVTQNAYRWLDLLLHYKKNICHDVQNIKYQITTEVWQVIYSGIHLNHHLD